jgi:transcriptional antiterminator RfaH
MIENNGNSTNFNCNKKWYVIYTKAKSESIASENLQRQNYYTYLPKVEIVKRRQGRLSPLISPFFPRYLFIQMDIKTDNWAPIRSTRGVCGVVKFEGIPKEVPTRLIQALKNNENSEQLQNITQSSWKEGDVVAIEQGPFSGYSCIFQGHRSSDRIAVLLDIIGKPTRAILDYQDLQIPEFA